MTRSTKFNNSSTFVPYVNPADRPTPSQALETVRRTMSSLEAIRHTLDGVETEEYHRMMRRYRADEARLSFQVHAEERAKANAVIRNNLLERAMNIS